MTRVEMVMLLQGIPIFKFCSVEETVRIAAIAREVVFEVDQEIFRLNDSAHALYCVASGEVSLTDESGAARTVSSSDSFGVLEILSGRLRRTTARACDRVVALEIEAEDFFDLLSNNVEIVKALFRELLGEKLSRSALT